MSNPIDGPWIVDEVNTPNGKAFQVSYLWEEPTIEGIETHTDQIAEVYMDYHDPGVAIAHARLLAAAPELLAALRGMIEGKVHYARNACHPSKQFCTVCGTNSERVIHHSKCPVEIAEAAIAKAEKGEILPAQEGATA